MRCDNCGNYNSMDSLYCGGCGKRIEKEKKNEANNNYNYSYSSSNLVKNESGLFKVLVTVSLTIIIVLASILIWRFVYVNKENAKNQNTDHLSENKYRIEVEEYGEDEINNTDINENQGINSINTGTGTINNKMENNMNNTTYNNEKTENTTNYTTNTTNNNININEVNTENNNYNH